MKFSGKGSTLGLKRMTDILSVVGFPKREDLRYAIENDFLIMLSGRTIEEKALIAKFKQYGVPYGLWSDYYIFPTGGKKDD